MLSEALPIYSGGLGNVVGDQLKSASNLGVPVIGVGLLYQKGYFRQTIDQDGAQQALYPYNDPGQLPVTPLRKDNEECLRLKLDLPGHPIWLRAWQVQVGKGNCTCWTAMMWQSTRCTEASPASCMGGGRMQELAFSIGGWRMLARAGVLSPLQNTHSPKRMPLSYRWA